LSQEKPGQTLQPTALVHEAYLRLVCPERAAGVADRCQVGTITHRDCAFVACD
jgi:hypothetical protein